MNIILSQARTSIVPEVGMGVTIICFSDREAATVIEVSKDKKTVIIQEDTAERIDKNGMCEHQEYVFTPNPSARKEVYRLRKNGRWVVKGGSMKNGQCILLGSRDKYYDYNF